MSWKRWVARETLETLRSSIAERYKAIEGVAPLNIEETENYKIDRSLVSVSQSTEDRS